VKYFNAEGREARRYEAAAQAFADAAVKSENSLGLLNIAQALIVNLLMAGAMAYTVWGWSQGRTYGWRSGFRPDLSDAAVPPARHARHGLSHDPPGPDRHGADVRSDRHAGRGEADAPGAPALIVSRPTLTFDNVVFGYEPDRTILNGLSFEVPAGHQVASSAHRARAKARSRGWCSGSTIRGRAGS
jgi:ABC-type multidrug transport system fused ATPase/permease subunit